MRIDEVHIQWKRCLLHFPAASKANGATCCLLHFSCSPLGMVSKCHFMAESQLTGKESFKIIWTMSQKGERIMLYEHMAEEGLDSFLHGYKHGMI